MKNPYIFGYLPFVTIVLFSLTFGVYTVGVSVELFKGIGLYAGMREFLTDIQLRIFLLVIYALLFFMVFSALKLIAETIHETAMLFFSKDVRANRIARLAEAMSFTFSAHLHRLVASIRLNY